MTNLWDIIDTLASIVLTIGQKIWDLLTTPVWEILKDWGVIAFFDDHELTLGWAKDIIYFLFGSKGTILLVVPMAIAVILIVRFVMVVFGR